MANNNDNGKEKIEVSLDKDLNRRLENYAEEQDVSVSSIVKALETISSIVMLKNACFEGKTLRPESKIFKKLEHEDI